MKSGIRQIAFAVVGVVLAFGWLAVHAAEPKPAGRVPAPTIKIEKGEQCVAPADEMRRNHMNMILHQRDRTVHEGIRSVKHSLKNCINCHASAKTNSVLGKEGFCESCHAYASVKLDCFECHSPSPQKANPLSRRAGEGRGEGGTVMPVNALLPRAHSTTLSPSLSRERERGSLGNLP